MPWIPAFAGMTNYEGAPLFIIPGQARIPYYAPVRQDFQPTVYMLASRRNGTLYTGVTSNLLQRIQQHREGAFGGFTERHTVHRLVWFEQHATMEHAITREKRLKKWEREWKLNLFEKDNPRWRDLAEDFGFPPLDDG